MKIICKNSSLLFKTAKSIIGEELVTIEFKGDNKTFRDCYVARSESALPSKSKVLGWGFISEKIVIPSNATSLQATTSSIKSAKNDLYVPGVVFLGSDGVTAVAAHFINDTIDTEQHGEITVPIPSNAKYVYIQGSYNHDLIDNTAQLKA